MVEENSHWVPLALSKDLPKGVVIPSRIGSHDIALWRSGSGQIQAWGDRCPHRGMRLSHGFVRGETLACIYHGWRYGKNGVCKHIPAHPALVPPDTIAAKIFHVCDAGGLIWGTADDKPGKVPQLEGFSPLRSMPVERAEGTVRTMLGGEGYSAIIWDGLALWVQPIGGANCMLHVLTGDGSDANASSARLEALRRNLESTL